MVDGLLTPRDVAEMLALKESTIRTYCRLRKIPSIRFGRDYRIHRPVADLLSQYGLPTRSEEGVWQWASGDETYEVQV